MLDASYDRDTNVPRFFASWCNSSDCRGSESEELPNRCIARIIMCVFRILRYTFLFAQCQSWVTSCKNLLIRCSQTY